MMYWHNGVWEDRKATEPSPAEEQSYLAEQAEAERTYWQQPYDELVNAEIRTRYTESQEFAILRQQTQKPEEYAEYYRYCEECKERVRAKQAEYGARNG